MSSRRVVTSALICPSSPPAPKTDASTRRTPCLLPQGSHRTPCRSVFLGRRPRKCRKTRPVRTRLLAGEGLPSAFLW
jgi:hypothetical protein